MKLVYKLTFLLLLCNWVGLNAQGPDDYGYTWMDSNDPAGPTFNWVDISTSGTEITGFADDNSVAFIDMGMDFHYYWLDFTQVKLGSNGWISFNNVSNIAACFPTIPTIGNGDNLICPLMADLNFAENGNPAKAYYQNMGDGRFVISYHNVPFWVNAVPAYTGDNTFQVILDQNDSSIVMQYLAMDDAVGNPGTCPAGEVTSTVGFENISGTIGLEIFANSVMPPDNYAVKIKYPTEVLIEIPDVAPDWNMNDKNGGVFVLPNEDIQISVNVSNTGNSDITSPFDVSAGMRKAPIPADLWTSSATINALPIAGSEMIDFMGLFNSDVTFGGPGHYSLTTATSLMGDLVGGNDETTSELVVVDNDSSLPEIPLTYSSAATNDGQISWAGGGGNSGLGIYIEPPTYPAVVKAIEIFTLNDPNGTLDDAYTIELRDDDGIDGSPGTLVGLESIDAGSYDNAVWTRTELSFPYEISSGGLYVAWIMQGNTLQIGTESAAPISRRTYEIISGSWAVYRSNEVTDAMIRVVIENDQFVDVDEVELQNNLAVFPNPTSDVINIESTLSENITNLEVYNTLGKLMINQKVNISNGERYQLNLNDLSSGVYFVNIFVDEQMTTRKISLIK